MPEALGAFTPLKPLEARKQRNLWMAMDLASSAKSSSSSSSCSSTSSSRSTSLLSAMTISATAGPGWCTSTSSTHSCEDADSITKPLSSRTPMIAPTASPSEQPYVFATSCTNGATSLANSAFSRSLGVTRAAASASRLRAWTMASPKTTVGTSFQMQLGELAGVFSLRCSGLASVSIGECELHSEGSYADVSTVSSPADRHELV
mmetsp:Transcript_67753/g.171541  ORF Transcript_67753/g.171541 Transcript_67753/m.171541 type:complete len:205 (-) Transcript_67753:197-811(-)